MSATIKQIKWIIENLESPQHDFVETIIFLKDNYELNLGIIDLDNLLKIDNKLLYKTILLKMSESICILNDDVFLNFIYRNSTNKMQKNIVDYWGKERIYQCFKNSLNEFKTKDFLKLVMVTNYAPKFILSNIMENYKKKSPEDSLKDIYFILETNFEHLSGREAYQIYSKLLKLSNYLKDSNILTVFFKKYETDDDFNKIMIMENKNKLEKLIPQKSTNIKIQKV